MRGCVAVLVSLLMLSAGAPNCTLAATLDVTTFGATPDGGGDDTAAINAAITAAQPGDTIFVPAGTFDCSGVVFAKSNTTLAGAGPASSLRYAGTAPIVILDIENVSNVNVNNLTFDGNNLPDLVQGIYAKNASNITLESLTIKDLGSTTGFGPHGIMCHANVTNSTFQNNTISNVGTGSNWGAGIRLGDDSAFNRVLNNTISNTGRGGILANDGSSDLLIKGNTVTGSGGTGLGIELQDDCDRSVIEDNVIDHWLSIDESHNLAVRRNVISDYSGIHKHAGIELVDSHDNVFTDNVVDRGAKYGISISGPQPKERILWTRNAIKTASTWGIQIQGEAGKASKMYFYKNSFQFTIRTGPDTNFPPQGHGVRFNGNANDIVFDDNLIDANLGSGVQLAGANLSDLAFVRNRITNNVFSAVTGSGVTNLTWQENVVTGNGDNSQPPETPPASSAASDSADALEVLIGEPVQFSFGGTFDDSELAAITGLFTNVLWDFGEGLPSTDFNPLHTYMTPGDYLVTVVGWDADGNAQLDQASVTVVPEPAMLGLVALTSLAMRRRRRRA